jgi:type I restriction enzyme R subunit
MKTYSRHDFTREERAARAKVAISAAFESKEQAFLDFVLSHYVRVGVQELDQEKLTPLLRLKYNNSIADAVAHLGKPEDIGRVFIGFQKYLYQQEARSRRNTVEPIVRLVVAVWAERSLPMADLKGGPKTT